MACKLDRVIRRQGLCNGCYRAALARGDRFRIKIWVEDIEMLVKAGAAWPEIEARIGKRNTVEQACYRAQRHDLARQITANGQGVSLAA